MRMQSDTSATVDVCCKAHRPCVASFYRCTMISTLLVVLVVLWLLGVTTAYTMGGFIHILLVLAIVVVLVRIIQGRNPLMG
jgi:Family of unknown function (DUF5670)